MTRRPKQIVIDKDVFVRLLGKEFGAFRSFCGRCNLLLADTLLYECATTRRQNPERLLDKCEELLKSGASYCSMSRRFVEWEAWRCRPYPPVLADQELTDSVRHGEVSVSSLLRSDVLEHQRDSRTRAAQAMLAEFSTDCMVKLRSCVGDVRGELKQIPNTPSKRIGLWLSRIDRMDIHAMALEALPSGWIRVKGEFCLSPAWVFWQHLRLVMVDIYEYCYIRETGDPRDKWAEHDLQDIEYALLLSRADGIITTDKVLIRLVRAAFPEKDVFSSLDEVLPSYRWDGAGA